MFFENLSQIISSYLNAFIFYNQLFHCSPSPLFWLLEFLEFGYSKCSQNSSINFAWGFVRKVESQVPTPHYGVWILPRLPSGVCTHETLKSTTCTMWKICVIPPKILLSAISICIYWDTYTHTHLIQQCHEAAVIISTYTMRETEAQGS